MRLIAHGATAVTDARVFAAPNGGNVIIGDIEDGGGDGTVGEIRDVAMGTDDLTTLEEAELFRGIIPADATQLYRLNEGGGRTAFDLKSGDDGVIDTAPTWETGLRQYIRY